MPCEGLAPRAPLWQGGRSSSLGFRWTPDWAKIGPRGGVHGKRGWGSEAVLTAAQGGSGDVADGESLPGLSYGGREPLPLEVSGQILELLSPRVVGDAFLNLSQEHSEQRTFFLKAYRCLPDPAQALAT